MTEAEMKQEILDYIKTLYKATYEGLLEIIKGDTYYTFKIGLPNYMSPLVISLDFGTDITDDTDEEFLDYIKEELRVRNYMRIYKYKVIKQPILKHEK